MGDPLPRYARRAEPQQVLRECPVTPYAADPGGGCRVSVSDSGREHGFGAPRLQALRFVRTARKCPRPLCNASHHGSAASCTPGVSRDRRLGPERSRAAAASLAHEGEAPMGNPLQGHSRTRTVCDGRKRFRGSGADGRQRHREARVQRQHTRGGMARSAAWRSYPSAMIQRPNRPPGRHTEGAGNMGKPLQLDRAAAELVDVGYYDPTDFLVLPVTNGDTDDPGRP